jgi:hypothetical protein
MSHHLICRVLILVNIRPMAYNAVVDFGLGNEFLSKSILGRCVLEGS